MISYYDDASKVHRAASLNRLAAGRAGSTKKYDLILNGQYGKSFYSTDVYDAVMDHDVRMPADFQQLHSQK